MLPLVANVRVAVALGLDVCLARIQAVVSNAAPFSAAMQTQLLDAVSTVAVSDVFGDAAEHPNAMVDALVGLGDYAFLNVRPGAAIRIFHPEFGQQLFASSSDSPGASSQKQDEPTAVSFGGLFFKIFPPQAGHDLAVSALALSLFSRLVPRLVLTPRVDVLVVVYAAVPRLVLMGEACSSLSLSGLLARSPSGVVVMGNTELMQTLADFPPPPEAGVGHSCWIPHPTWPPGHGRRSRDGEL